MCNLIEYNNNFSGTARSLWQYHKDQPKSSLTDSNSFELKIRFLANTNHQGIINEERAVQLKT